MLIKNAKHAKHNFWSPNIQFSLDLYTLICISSSNEKPSKDVICSSSSSSRSQQNHQSGPWGPQQQLQVGSSTRGRPTILSFGIQDCKGWEKNLTT